MSELKLIESPTGLLLVEDTSSEVDKIPMEVSNVKIENLVTSLLKPNIDPIVLRKRMLLSNKDDKNKFTVLNLLTS